MKNNVKKFSLIFGLVVCFAAVMLGIFLLNSGKNIPLSVSVFYSETGEYCPGFNGGEIAIFNGSEKIETITQNNKLTLPEALENPENLTIQATPNTGFGFAGFYSSANFSAGSLLSNNPNFAPPKNTKVFAKFGSLVDVTFNVTTENANLSQQITTQQPLTKHMQNSDFLAVVNQNCTPEITAFYANKTAELTQNSSTGSNTFQITTTAQTLTLQPAEIDSVGTAYTVTFNANGGTVSQTTKTVNVTAVSFTTKGGGNSESGTALGNWYHPNTNPTSERYWTCTTAGTKGPYLTMTVLTVGQYYILTWDMYTTVKSIFFSVIGQDKGMTTFNSSTSYSNFRYAFKAVESNFGDDIAMMYSDEWEVGMKLYIKNMYIYTTQTYGTLPIPTREGYTFDGWYDSDFHEYNVVPNNLITSESIVSKISDHTLYAKWVPNNKKITFNTNGGKCESLSKSINIQPVNISGVSFQPGIGGTCRAVGIWSSTDSNLSAERSWTCNSITDNIGGGGGAIWFTPDIVRNDYYIYEMTMKASKNIKLHDTGFEMLDYSIGYVKELSTTYKKFSYCGKSKSDPYSRLIVFASGIKDTARASEAWCVGDILWVKDIKLYKTQTYGLLPTPTKAGYEFAGWYLDENFTKRVTSETICETIADHTLYAKWNANPTYTVHYDANGGSGSMNNSTHVYGVNSPLSACTFTRQGYVFLGWSENKNDVIQTYNNKQKVSDLSSTNGDTITLYAIWLKKDITVTVDPNGGVYNGVETATVYNCSVGSDLVLGVPSRQGYEFTEFNTSGDGMGQTLNGTMVLNGDVTFYALWQPLNYVIKYYDGDLYLGQTEAWYNENLSLPRWETLLSNNSLTGGKFKQYGWNFAGWTSEQSGTQIQHTNGGAVLNLAEAGTTINLYAMHTQTLNLTYNGNGSTSGNVANQNTDILLNSKSEKLVDFVIKLASNSYAKTNYSFKNWAIGSTSGTQKSAGANITNVDLGLIYSSSFNKTIYAIWQGNSYTINYYNGTSKISTGNYVYGNVSALKTFSTIGEVLNLAYGWEFYGWATANNTFTRVFVDGANITNISVENGAEITQNMAIDLYSIYSREVSFVSGLNKASTTTATQFWNPYSTENTNLSSVLAEAPQTIEAGGWVAVGYRADITAGAATFAITTTTEIRPTANVFNTIYAVYSRTITIADLNTTTTATQHYNSVGTTSTFSV